MEEIWRGLVKAIQLIVSLDPEVMEITARSLLISVTACVLSALICLPLGGLIHFHRFPGKRTVINLIQTFYSIPTVAIGLFVFVLFSGAGPMGSFNLLFTPTVMILGQMVLVAPLLMGMTISALSGVDRAIPDTAVSLGAGSFQAVSLVIREARFAVVAALIMGFGRAISEVGLALMVGGNISGFTRVITTAIALETSKDDIELSIALGIILVLIALVINIGLNRVQQR